ncbi:MAG: cytidine deaminase [Lysobacterales bacterium]
MSELRALALAASFQSYAPHSQLSVGAAVRSSSGACYSGCNVENASFSIGGCAERAAISAAVLAEGAAFRLAAIAVVARDARGHELPVPPCGACRQAIVEFGAEAEVEFLGSAGDWQTVRASALLPYQFVLEAR